MAFDYHDTFGRIIAKANVLVERYTILADRKKEAEEQVELLKKELAEKDKEIRMLKAEIEQMRIAAVITPDREHIEQTRAIISGLVRDIDRCIADITE